MSPAILAYLSRSLFSPVINKHTIIFPSKVYISGDDCWMNSVLFRSTSLLAREEWAGEEACIYTCLNTEGCHAIQKDHDECHVVGVYVMNRPSGRSRGGQGRVKVAERKCFDQGYYEGEGVGSPCGDGMWECRDRLANLIS